MGQKRKNLLLLVDRALQNPVIPGEDGGMSNPSGPSEVLLRQAGAGMPEALAALFAHYRDRLWRMVHLRLDRRLQGRLDPEDVLQETYLVFARRFDEYARAPAVPIYLWLRSLAGQKLIDLHREHLGAQKRDAGQEVSLYRGALPQASSVSLAARLLGKLTAPSQAAIRAEVQMRIQEAVNSLDPIDREVLALRDFEMLTNEETAAVLGIGKSAASKRHLQALKRLKEVLAGLPGLADHLQGK
jgi:RNA polymerase sigma-70 factor (ECF subfamily)